jgi:hypothetical protein
MSDKLNKGVDAGVGVVYAIANIVWTVIFVVGGAVGVATGQGGVKFLGILAILFGLWGGYRTVRMWVPKK